LVAKEKAAFRNSGMVNGKKKHSGKSIGLPDYRHSRVPGSLVPSLISNSFTLVFQTDLSGKILFCNKLFSETFEIDLLLQHATIQDHWVMKDGFTFFKDRVLSSKVKCESLTLKTPRGAEIKVLTNCEAVVDQSDTTFLNWTALDITDQIIIDQRLQEKTSQLENVTMQLERFLYSTSHDLRSPITSILGLVNLVRSESNEPGIMHYIKKIEETTLKLDHVIQEINDFSKTRNKSNEVEKIEIESLLWNTIQKYIKHENFQSIDFEVVVPGNTDFYSDLERFNLICDNLIANAIQFADPQKIQSFVRIKVWEQSGELHMEIHDNGQGIRSQFLDKIFTMFYRASAESSGAGLGLFIVKQAVDQLRGSISVESELGFGTVVTFKLPLTNLPALKGV
jgi:signal transduction histidine kinase